LILYYKKSSYYRKYYIWALTGEHREEETGDGLRSYRLRNFQRRWVFIPTLLVTWLVRNESRVHLPLKGGEHPPRAPFHSLTTSHRSCCSSSGNRERRALLHLSRTNLSLLQQERRKKRRFQIPGPKEQRSGVHPRLSLSLSLSLSWNSHIKL
jgi:hypothetical protein